jgi:hypothetical protein
MTAVSGVIPLSKCRPGESLATCLDNQSTHPDESGAWFMPFVAPRIPERRFIEPVCNSWCLRNPSAFGIWNVQNNDQCNARCFLENNVPIEDVVKWVPGALPPTL